MLACVGLHPFPLGFQSLLLLLLLLMKSSNHILPIPRQKGTVSVCMPKGMHVTNQERLGHAKSPVHVQSCHCLFHASLSHMHDKSCEKLSVCKRKAIEKDQNLPLFAPSKPCLVAS